MIISPAAASNLPIKWAGFECHHGQLTTLDMESSGMLNSSNLLHGAFGGEHSMVLALDVRPLPRKDSEEGEGGEDEDSEEEEGDEGGGCKGEGSEEEDGSEEDEGSEEDPFDNLEFVGDKKWFHEKVAKGVEVRFTHETIFPREKWQALKNEIFDYNKREGLFYLSYDRGAYATGFSWSHGQEDLVQFEEFNEYLDKISEQYEILAGWLSINVSGTHGLHQDTFRDKATNRLILTLGGINKKMIFAEKRSGVSNDAMSYALKEHLQKCVSIVAWVFILRCIGHEFCESRFKAAGVYSKVLNEVAKWGVGVKKFSTTEEKGAKKKDGSWDVHPKHWDGQNILGRCLMDVRDKLLSG